MKLMRFWHFACLGSMPFILTFSGELRRQNRLKPVQTWAFGCLCLPGNGERSSIRFLKMRVFCKIPLPCFASDLAVAEEQAALKEKTKTGQVISYKDCQCKSQGGCDSKTEISCKTSIPPQAGRKMGRMWEATVMLCTGHREICKNMYFVSLQLIAMLDIYATKWQCYDNDKCLNVMIRIHYNH